MLGKRISRGRAFTMCHAFVLTGFIALAHLMGPFAKGSEVHLSEIERTFSNSVFEGSKGPFVMRAAFHESGDVVLTGVLGQFQGTWREFSGEICLDFETGPRAGHHCSAVMHVAEGRFETEDGVMLRRISHIRHF